jgi:hypothetical protein
MAYEIPPETESRARSLFGDLLQGRWESVRGEFDVSMRGHPDADRVGRACTRVAEDGGSFEGTGTSSARRSGEYAVVDVPLIFGAGNGIGRMVLDGDGKVTGLRLEYPRRHRLDPRRVHVFALGNGSPEVAGALRAPLHRVR